MSIMVASLVGENCLTIEDGQNIHELIHSDLLHEKEVTLDFTGVQVFASPFFNTAIGQLLRDISPETLNKYLHVESLTVYGNRVLRRVILNAQKYYKEPHIRRAVDDALLGAVGTA
ncbi:MAG: STAS-like domain-containing protein [Methanobacteriota archaeon]